MESNQSKQNRERNEQNKHQNYNKPRDNKEKPLNTLGDLYDLRKMCRDKGFKLKD